MHSYFSLNIEDCAASACSIVAHWFAYTCNFILYYGKSHQVQVNYYRRIRNLLHKSLTVEKTHEVSYPKIYGRCSVNREESRQSAPDSASVGRMSRQTRGGTAEPVVSRDQILRRERGQGNIDFPCSGNHDQDLQPYPVDPYSALCDDYTCIHTSVFKKNEAFWASTFRGKHV